jgi:hypothetical protein
MVGSSGKKEFFMGSAILNNNKKEEWELWKWKEKI